MNFSHPDHLENCLLNFHSPLEFFPHNVDLNLQLRYETHLQIMIHILKIR